MWSPAGDKTGTAHCFRTLCLDTVPDRLAQIHRSRRAVNPNIGLGKAVAPDLPYVRQDVPDDSEAPKVGGRRQAGKESRTPAVPPASKGTTAFCQRFTPRVLPRCERLWSWPSPRHWPSPCSCPASADELTTQRARVKQQIAKSKSELNESTKELSAAVIQVDKAQNKLDRRLPRGWTTTRQELRVAQTKDAHMATKREEGQGRPGRRSRRRCGWTGPTGGSARESRTGSP